MATKIEEKRQEALAAREAVRAERAKYDEDNLPSLEDVARLEALVNAEADITDYLGKIDSALAVQVLGNEPRASFPHERGNNGKPVDRRSIGQRMVEDPAFAAWHKSVAPNGRIPKGVKLESPVLEVGALREFGLNAALVTGDSSTSGGAFITTERQSELTLLGRRPLTVRDIIRNLRTGSDLVDFVRQTARTNAAVVVPEATATAGSSGLKPESDVVFEVVSAPVKTIANWMAITKQALADVPQLQGIIDTELRDNLEETLETEIVTGSVFPGIFNTTGTQVQAWDTNILTTLRKAKTKVSTVGRTTPNAYVLTPATWESIDLLQDNEARYYYGGPAAVGVPRVWGLPVVESEAPPAGYGLVGNFQKAILWDREQATVAISDSHADFFIRNLIAVLAELRAAFGVLQPSAFVEIDTAA